MSWRSVGLSATLLIVGVVGLPSFVQAQLFPNLPIRRQRVTPSAEPPFYSNIRQNYYGYYPTCWQKFPEGWACPCPNPEAPDIAAAFRARPRDEKQEVPPDDDLGNLPDPGAGPGPGPGTGAPGGARPRPNGLPPVPDGNRSPFELDGRRPNADPDLPAPNDGGRLRDLPTTPPAGTAPTTPGGARPMPPAGGGTRPGADPFVIPPTSMRRPSPTLPEITVSGPALASADGSSRPMLELPEMSGAPTAGAPIDTQAAQPFPSSLPPNGTLTDNGASVAPADPATAPKRQSVISGLFGGLNRRRR